MENIGIIDEINTISISKILLLYYLLTIHTNSPIISKQLRNFVQHDRLIQHMVSFITIMVLITMLHQDKIDNVKLLVYSVITYLLFLISTKLDIHWNVIVLLLLVFVYLYDVMIGQKEKEVIEDQVLTLSEKQKIKSNLHKQKIYMLAIVVFSLVVGVCLYSEKKHVQYGGGYSLVNFLLY